MVEPGSTWLEKFVSQQNQHRHQYFVFPWSVSFAHSNPQGRAGRFLLDPFSLGEVVAVDLSVCFQASVLLTPGEQAESTLLTGGCPV